MYSLRLYGDVAGSIVKKNQSFIIFGGEEMLLKYILLSKVIFSLFALCACKENILGPDISEIRITKITNISNSGVSEVKMTPDRSRVMYRFTENGGQNYGIRICDIYGNNDTLIVKMDNINKYVMSPDQKYFVFSNELISGVESLFLLDLSTNILTKLAGEDSPIDTAFYPIAFSADNKKILISAYYYLNSVYLLDLDTRAVINLTGNKSARPISFTPSGNNILYESLNNLCIINTDGSDDKVILEGYCSISFTGFTADGNNIIFSAIKEGEMHKNIYIMNIDDSKLDYITNFRADSYSNDISIDGKCILFTSNKNSFDLRLNVFLKVDAIVRSLVDSDYDDRGIGFTNIPNKVLITRTNLFDEPNNIYLVEY